LEDGSSLGSIVSDGEKLSGTLSSEAQGVHDAVNGVESETANTVSDAALTKKPYDSNTIQKSLEDKYGAQNVAKISKDPETGRAVIETTQGTKGGWNQFLNNVEPNTDYKFNGSVYKTDNLGRVEEASFSPSDASAARNAHQQLQAGKTDGIKDALPNDQGGHINAAQNGGAGEQINYLPQDATVNNGVYKSLETSWNKAASEGKQVDVTVKPIYEGISKRLSEFRVQYTIDGTMKEKIFDNTPTGGN
jgi:filamentous hemagglutinin